MRTLWSLENSDTSSGHGVARVRTNDNGESTLLINSVVITDTLVNRGTLTQTGDITASGALTIGGILTANGAVVVSDSDIKLLDLPSGNDTSAFGIGRIYTDTTSFLKISKG